MRLTDEAILRESRGKLILLVFKNKDTKAMEVNESFAFLWNYFQGKVFSLPDIADTLSKEYDLDSETAMSEAHGVVSLWREKNLLVE